MGLAYAGTSCWLAEIKVSAWDAEGRRVFKATVSVSAEWLIRGTPSSIVSRRRRHGGSVWPKGRKKRLRGL